MEKTDKKSILGSKCIICEYLCTTCKKCCTEHKMTNKEYVILNCKALGKAQMDDLKNEFENNNEMQFRNKASADLTKITSEIEEMIQKIEKDVIGPVNIYLKELEKRSTRKNREKYIKLLEQLNNEEKFIKKYKELIKFNENEIAYENKEDL